MGVSSSNGGAQRDGCGSARSSGSDRSLPRSERLRHRSEFRRVYDHGTSYPSSSLVLFVLEHEELERKAGFVAGRRVGNSVARSRAKRLLREVFRHHKHAIPERGHHVVLVARSGCSNARFADVERDFLDLLRRARFNKPQ